MRKIDLKQELKQLYSPSAKAVSVVEVPDIPFLMIDGVGDPNSAPAFSEAVEALYGVAYALKFMLKRGPAALDAVVMPLEGLWWADDMAAFTALDKAAWRWTLMIAQPEQATATLFEEALAEVARKKRLPGLAQLRYERFHEGLSAQIMHLGPYAAEGPTIAGLHRFIAEHGYAPRGKHHEIYLGDPRKAAPEKMKTVLRQPIETLI